MMNVTEARQLTKEYIVKENNKHLELIEHLIRQVASAGGWKCCYSNNIIAARPEVSDSVVNTLREKGYKVKWEDNGWTIAICWSES